MDLEPLPPDSDPSDSPSPSGAGYTTPAARRRPLLWAGAGTAMALAVGGYAVGTALSSTPAPTVQLANTAAPSAAGGASAPAGPTLPRGRGLAGKVTAIHGTSLVVATKRGSITVQTDGSTTYTMETTGHVSDAKVGTRVLVRGTPGATNTIAAQQVLVLPTLVPSRPKRLIPPAGANPPSAGPSGADGRAGLAIGTVATNDAARGTLTITTVANTTVTVTTDSKTTVLEMVTASFDQVKVNDIVAVRAARANGNAPGGTTANGSAPTTVTATHIDIVPAALAAGSLHSGGFSTFPSFPFGGRFGQRQGPATGQAPAPPGDHDDGTAQLPKPNSTSAAQM